MVAAPVEEEHLVGGAIDHADEAIGLVDRPGGGPAGDAEVALHVAEEGHRVHARAVALVDEGDDRHPAALADLEELPGALLDALPVVEQHDGAVRRHERPVGVLGEVLVAGGVQQVHLAAGVLELQDAGGHGDAALALQFHPVGGDVAVGAAGLDGAGQVDGAAVEQQLLRERGLAGVGMADDGKGATTGDLAVQVRRWGVSRQGTSSGSGGRDGVAWRRRPRPLFCGRREMCRRR